MFDAVVAKAIDDAWQQNKKTLSHPSNPRYLEHTSPSIHRDGLTIDYKQLKLSQDSSAGTWVAENWNRDHANNSTSNTLESRLTLNYTTEIIGDPLADSRGRPLYIALHGGGGPTTTTPDATKGNDEQWESMANLYKGAITTGVWISARGVGDSWDMHFTGASFVLIERLIENMIIFGAPDKRTTSPVAIDPNRVYLIGFSAGGDGVFRLAPRLAQRFAAVNMGAGHPGPGCLGDEVMSSKIADTGLTPPPRTKTILRNLVNTPICLQVGEEDSEYDRSRRVAQSAMDLDEMKTYYTTKVFQGTTPMIYTHNVFIHPTDPVPPGKDLGEWRHNSWESVNFGWSDPNKARGQQPVISDYATWKTNWANGMPNLARGTVQRSTNAIDWLNQYTRKSWPQAIVWDLSQGGGANEQFDTKVFAGLSGNGAQNYWLDISGRTDTNVGALIEARIDYNTSTIHVTSAGDYLRILLRPEMVSNMSNVKVQIMIGGQSQTLGPYKLGWNQAIINHTLARNDPNLIFSSDIVMTLVDKVWKGTTSSPALVKSML
ncbi:hypothetical protein G7054_g10770 [Neopestalotiopsis clavispora]|nr:hypothetical protein E8E14_007753 [Neopestalotiopsis sp. 37M]KAF7526498.1 hypothetical protein G7054_g10770 [Neopestalotiopsis clavispora]